MSLKNDFLCSFFIPVKFSLKIFLGLGESEDKEMDGIKFFKSSFLNLDHPSYQDFEDYSGLLVVGDIHGNIDSLLHILQIVDKMVILPPMRAKVFVNLYYFFFFIIFYFFFFIFYG
jgi:hypothetical protein